MIHHLKIYPEHFSAVCTGVKRAELRKNDRDFKVGDTLHLMETPKGSCNPTGEFINAVVTHIADVGEWLPGYVMLSIEREPGYAAPQLPQPAVEALKRLSSIVADPKALPRRKEWIGGQQYSYVLLESVEAMVDDACRAAMLQGNHRDLSYPIDPQVAAYEKIMEQAIPDGYALVPVEPTMAVLDEFDSIIDHGAEDSKDAWSRLLAAAAQQEDKA